MKRFVLIAAVFFTAADVFGQGTVTFANSSSTAVTNILTFQRVVAGNTFNAALYFLPDEGITPTTEDFDADGLLLSPAVSFSFPGLFNGGTRTAPITPAGGFGYFQVRVWETAYGNNYLEAATAPSMGGRSALIGTSNILRIDTGNPTTVPAGTPTTLTSAGLRGFYVQPTAGYPSISIDDITVMERSGVNAVFVVRLSRASDRTISVHYATADQTAVANSDYQATSGRVSIAPGDLQVTIGVGLIEDRVAEPDETFVVLLDDARAESGDPPIITKRKGTCTISELRIQNFAISGSDALITFRSLSGQTYAVDKTLTLAPINWRPLVGSTNAGTGGAITVTDHGGAGLRQSHYRIRVVQ